MPPLSHHLHIPPSPIPTRRDRRQSVSERAMSGPSKEGLVKWFCRQKGHGFLTPKSGGDDLFFHILDIDGEFAPHDGDEVTYKLTPLPPNFDKMQAVHVVIRNLAPGVRHERWSEAPQAHAHPHPAPNVASPELTDEQLKKLSHD